MKYNIYEKLVNVKSGDNKSTEQIIDMFKPLIKKYSILLDGEDTKQDLLVYLMIIIKKIPINRKNFFEDKAIVKYIAKSLRNEYIRLSKIRDRKKINEIELNLDLEIPHETFDSKIELIDLFNNLTENESNIMKLLFIRDLTIVEVADLMKISRQAVNQAKNRALKKLSRICLD